jgi:hypothetical protein
MCCLLFIVALACNTQTNLPTPTSTAPVLPTAAPPTTAPRTPSATKQKVGAPTNIPDTRADQASDPDSSIDAHKKMIPGGDTFVNDLFERPFNANTMDTYFPNYDIVDTQGFKDDTWGYATITLSGLDANNHLSGKYGVEIDLDKDGRGDFLILSSNPLSTNWTRRGVQAWKDSNGDVGGTVPIVADEDSTGDGYETIIFNQGKSDFPKGAWVRISPDDPKTIDLAFMLVMLGNPASFAMGTWAGSNASINPAQFDLNDHMTHIQAGDPDPSMQVYPLKGLSEIDNTCRLAIGFVPNGKEPGLCSAAQPKKPASPGAPQPPPGWDPFILPG